MFAETFFSKQVFAGSFFSPTRREPFGLGFHAVAADCFRPGAVAGQRARDTERGEEFRPGAIAGKAI